MNTNVLKQALTDMVIKPQLPSFFSLPFDNNLSNVRVYGISNGYDTRRNEKSGDYEVSWFIDIAQNTQLESVIHSFVCEANDVNTVWTEYALTLLDVLKEETFRAINEKKDLQALCYAIAVCSQVEILSAAGKEINDDDAMSIIESIPTLHDRCDEYNILKPIKKAYEAHYNTSNIC